MVSISLLDSNSIGEYCKYVDECCGAKSDALIMLEENEVYNVLDIKEGDCFVCIKFKGKQEELDSELNMIKQIPLCGNLVAIVKGYEWLALTDVAAVSKEIIDWLCVLEYNLITGVTISDKCKDDIEVDIVVKSHFHANLSDEKSFFSLWRKVLNETGAAEDKSFYEAVKDIKAEIRKCDEWINRNYKYKIMLKAPEERRIKFLLSLKKEDYEKLISKYTGEEYVIEFVE